MKNSGWLWLFIVPCIALSFPQWYSRMSPEVLGVPFFYWYQIAWVPLIALIIGIVHRKTRPDEERD
jgi:hypothetical protein